MYNEKFDVVDRNYIVNGLRALKASKVWEVWFASMRTGGDVVDKINEA